MLFKLSVIQQSSLLGPFIGYKVLLIQPRAIIVFLQRDNKLARLLIIVNTFKDCPGWGVNLGSFSFCLQVLYRTATAAALVVNTSTQGL
jgi:hypothetical protein